MATLELFGTASCPHTGEMREWLELRHREFVEFDVEADSAARTRLQALSGASHTIVPVLVEDGKIIQTGWQGRGCAVSLV